jgi:translation initiation factor IF-1
MTKPSNYISVDGEVRELLPNTMYKIALPNGEFLLATPAGRLRRSFVRIMPGDRVKVEMAPYDKSRGRIIYKYNK